MDNYTAPSYAVQLRDYQSDGVGAIREALSRHKRVLYVLPTGGGKTVIFSYITYHAMRKGSRVMILAHRREIVDQISLALDAMGVPHSMVVAGARTSPEALQPICVGMVQSVANRLQRLPTPDLLVLDEAHHAVAGTWARLLEHWSDAYVLGVTATPERLDGQGLRSVGFEVMVEGPDVGWLIEHGHLAKFKYLGADVAKFDDVSTVGGDYAADEIEIRMSRSGIVGDVIAHYRKHLEGRTAIVFCATVSHAERIAAAYRVAGIPAASIDGSMGMEERREVVRQLRDGEIMILTSCQVISEGFDAPAVGGCQLLRPTQSFALFRQQIGRCLRPKADGQHAVILDHVGNFRRHGLPDEPHVWSLDSEKRSAAERKQERPERHCKACGQVFPINYRQEPCGLEDCIFAPKEPLETAGELTEIVAKPKPPDNPDRADWAGRMSLSRGNYRLLLERAAGNYDRLMQIARARGYKPGWAWHKEQEWRQEQAMKTQIRQFPAWPG